MIRRAEERDIPGILELLVQVDMVHHLGRPDLFRGPATKYSGEELRESGRVFLLLREEGLPRLVVFGDPDSRRAVRDVVRVAADGPDAGTPAP